jgi:hypothetical protein
MLKLSDPRPGMVLLFSGRVFAVFLKRPRAPYTHLRRILKTLVGCGIPQPDMFFRHMQRGLNISIFTINQ